MKIFVLSLASLVDVITLLGYKTLQGVCSGGSCTFATKGDIALVVPENLFLWGPLVILNTIGVGTFLFSRKGGKAMIKKF